MKNSKVINLLKQNVSLSRYNDFKIQTDGKQYLIKAYKDKKHKASFVIITVGDKPKSILKLKRKVGKYTFLCNGQPSKNTKLIAWL